MASKQITAIDKALLCAKCGVKAAYVEECHETVCAEGEILLIQCPAFDCKEKPWFYCNTCKKKCYRSSLLQHSRSKKHIERKAILNPPVPAPPPDPPAATATQNEAILAFPGDYPMDGIDLQSMDGIEAEAISESMEDVLNMNSHDFHLRMDQELAATHVDDSTSSMEAAVHPISNEASITLAPNLPKISLKGNEWLVKATSEIPRATRQEMYMVFRGQGMESMKQFWVAEHGTGEGRCGGGMMYLVARAFQQVKDAQLDPNRVPDFEEAVWQFTCLVQYHSMNAKQRSRQSHLGHTLLQHLPLQDTFFKHTCIPHYNQLGRFYGSTGQHSMWNNLPCPKARDIDGVAYVSPRAIVASVMANGIPIDDVLVTANDDVVPFDPERKVEHVCQSRKAVNWMNNLREAYYGAGTPNSNHGAPNSNSNHGAPKFPVAICLGLSDWADGFGPGKVKNNRNSVDCKTFTISAPKDVVNATDNTFLVAVGMKKAKGWSEVERLFREEVEELTSSKEPILFYHGVLQKIVPCFFKRFVVMSDKAERNGLSGTIGCGSDNHRCFSVSGKISTPCCDVEGITDLLKDQANGGLCPFGWSDKYVSRKAGAANGAILPACVKCRKEGLRKLGVLRPSKQDESESHCPKCSNWDLFGSSRLDFPAHNDYPVAIADGSPVPPPKGRDQFKEGVTLPFVQLSWDLMKSACKFAFYQASRPGRGKAWTKATTLCYLRYCGIATNHASNLYDCAKASKTNNTVDYNCPNRIGGFTFPSAWLSQDISLRDHVEAVMHQLFLGVAESNYDLVSIWLKESPSWSNLAQSTFKGALQQLIKDLRPFQLAWLAAYPLTGKKGDLGTGSWVAENWVFYVRISQFIHGWCIGKENASKWGVEDLSRMVISFVAFCSRCLTHGGIDDDYVAETELYLKEFLSSLREFDVRVRHRVHNRKAKATDRKNAEAWWLKPNYMSLWNLLSMMLMIGPLILWWDGGGKGERFIQVVKPYIKRGVREDIAAFFVNLLDKLYQEKQLDLLEMFYGIHGDGLHQNDENQASVLDVLHDMLGPRDDNEEENGGDNDNASKSDPDDNSTSSSDDDCDEQQDATFSANEILGMTKTRTIFIYRNEAQLVGAIQAIKPLAGIVEVTILDTGETAFEFLTVFRKPVKQFGFRSVSFDDHSGEHYHGLWCANIEVKECTQSTNNLKEIQTRGSLAAAAIPLWYIVGKDRPNSNKYCVITNWWKYRMQDGWYRLPTLDATLSGNNKSTRAQNAGPIRVRKVNGMLFGEI